jgi:hypothetical protein
MDDLRSRRADSRNLQVGLPYHFSKPKWYYLTAPAELFIDEFVLHQVRVRYSEMIAVVRSVPVKLRPQHFEEVISKKHVREFFSWDLTRGGRFTFQDLWSLMIIDWVLSTKPGLYLNGRKDIRFVTADAFGMKWDDSFLIRAHINKMFDESRSNKLREISAWVKMEDDYRERLQTMTKIVEVYETYTRVWLLIFSLLTGTASTRMISIFNDLFMGFMDFTIELYDIMKDDLITDEESQNVWISLLSVALPLGGLFGRGVIGKGVKVLAEIASYTLLAYSLCLLMIAAIIEIIGKWERMLAANNAGFVNIVELNREMSLYIPTSI